MSKCDHITECITCGKTICSYCVEDCSGCNTESCKECYKLHMDDCDECKTNICPKELIGKICPVCNMKHGV